MRAVPQSRDDVGLDTERLTRNLIRPETDSNRSRYIREDMVPFEPMTSTRRTSTSVRAAEVKALLMRPLPPEGAFVTGPWGWGQSSAKADAILRRYRSLLSISGLTTKEIARSMVEWSQQRARLLAREHGDMKLGISGHRRRLSRGRRSHG